MSVARRQYVGNAAATTLAARMSLNAGTFVATDATNYPTGAGGTTFVIIVDGGTSREEHILCSSRSGNLFIVAGGGRGFDGTRPYTHPVTARVEHQVTASDIDPLNRHAADTTLDEHTQYLNEARHQPLVHTVAQPVEIRVAGTPVSPIRAAINLAGVASSFESITDDATNDEVDVTLQGLPPEAMTKLGGGGGVAADQSYGYIPGFSPTSVSTMPHITGRIYYFPFKLRSDLTLAEGFLYNVALLSEVTSATAEDQNIWLGIYRADENWQPGELVGGALANGATFLAGSSGGATATLTLAPDVLTQGSYLFALSLVHPTATDTLTFRTLNGTGVALATGLGASAYSHLWHVDIASTESAPLTNPGRPWNADSSASDGFRYPIVMSLVLVQP